MLRRSARDAATREPHDASVRVLPPRFDTLQQRFVDDAEVFVGYAEPFRFWSVRRCPLAHPPFFFVCSRQLHRGTFPSSGRRGQMTVTNMRDCDDFAAHEFSRRQVATSGLADPRVCGHS